jgi:predicted nucleic acid-binding protein
MKTFAIDTNVLVYAHNSDSIFHEVAKRFLETVINEPNAMELLSQVTSRKQIFDVAIAAILKDNDVFGIYTANVDDFNQFNFLEVINPLEST